MKPSGRVKIRWSNKFAYAIGLITTDGSLSSDCRHISFTSKDEEMVKNFLQALSLKNHIGRKGSGSTIGKKYFVVQLGDVKFYNFLCSIGLKANKTKILDKIKVPSKYFLDFLRGHFDGDGSFFSYYDKRWKSSLMFYLAFVSASKEHIMWLRKEIAERLGVKGHITISSVYQLKYAKAETVKIVKSLYKKNCLCLSRKYNKIMSVLGSL